MAAKEGSKFVEVLQKDIHKHGGVDGFVSVLYDFNPRSIISKDIVLDWLTGNRRPTKIKLNHLSLALSYSDKLFEEKEKGSLVSDILQKYYCAAGYRYDPKQTWHAKIEESIDNNDFEIYVGYVTDENHSSHRFVPIGEWPKKIDNFFAFAIELILMSLFFIAAEKNA